MKLRFFRKLSDVFYTYIYVSHAWNLSNIQDEFFEKIVNGFQKFTS